MVDNYDSFTFNLVHYLQQLDCEVVVKRNDHLSIADIKQIAPSHIVISPGPCDPNKAGLSLTIIEELKDKLPILGVCLGHQTIAQAFGAKIVKAPIVMHGKTSQIFHADLGVFSGLAQGFSATRYHSLTIDPKTLPDCLKMTAWTQNDDAQVETIMGIKHRIYPIEGVQFHPESVLSENGLRMLKQFIEPVRF